VDPGLTLNVAVPSSPRGYPVRVAAGVLAELPDHLRRVAPRASTVALVSDTNVLGHHGGRVTALLAGLGLRVVPQTVAPGEASKSAEHALAMIDALALAGLGRDDVVVALGGGVVGDLAGLVAHLFMRGLPIVQCPSSLLAQVDASVGGKVAIDRPGGKNLLGAFHFPAAVLVDPELLATLPPRERSCGAAEMIKHGLLFSASHLDALEQGAQALLAAEPVTACALVSSSIALKAACVAADPFERRRDPPGTRARGRVVLNLGHTVAHAIEHASGLTVPHGEAVGLGLRAAARLSWCRGLAEPELEARVVELLQRFALPVELDPWLVGARGDALLAAMQHDKKRGGDTLTYIALAGVGEPRTLALRPGEIIAALAGSP
jgi:3-dehydroquinate synthase